MLPAKPMFRKLAILTFFPQKKDFGDSSLTMNKCEASVPASVVVAVAVAIASGGCSSNKDSNGRGDVSLVRRTQTLI